MNLKYQPYKDVSEIPKIKKLMDVDLSEPYSIYIYRYFIFNWPSLCLTCYDGDVMIGAIVCKKEVHKKSIRKDRPERGYIAMVAVDPKYRKCGIGSKLVELVIVQMWKEECTEIVLETECCNHGALALYKKLGFLKVKRLHKYYLNNNDSFRLKLKRSLTCADPEEAT